MKVIGGIHDKVKYINKDYYPPALRKTASNFKLSSCIKQDKIIDISNKESSIQETNFNNKNEYNNERRIGQTNKIQSNIMKLDSNELVKEFNKNVRNLDKRRHRGTFINIDNEKIMNMMKEDERNIKTTKHMMNLCHLKLKGNNLYNEEVKTLKTLHGNKVLYNKNYNPETGKEYQLNDKNEKIFAFHYNNIYCYDNGEFIDSKKPNDKNQDIILNKKLENGLFSESKSNFNQTFNKGDIINNSFFKSNVNKNNLLEGMFNNTLNSTFLKTGKTMKSESMNYNNFNSTNYNSLNSERKTKSIIWN